MLKHVYTAKRLQPPTSLGVVFWTYGDAVGTHMLARLLASGHVEQSVCSSFLEVYVIFQVYPLLGPLTATRQVCACSNAAPRAHPRSFGGLLCDGTSTPHSPVAVLRFAPGLWVTGHRAPPHTLPWSCGGVSRLRPASLYVPGSNASCFAAVAFSALPA